MKETAPTLIGCPEGHKPVFYGTIKFHPENKKRIKAAIKEIRQAPHSGGDLQEELSGFKSYRSRRYRIIYRLNEKENIIQIYHVGHPRDVYDQAFFERVEFRVDLKIVRTIIGLTRKCSFSEGR